MSMETYSASLHAGLIQRTRPAARVVPLRELSRAPLATHRKTEAAAPAGAIVAALHESEIRPAPASAASVAAVGAIAAPAGRWSFRRRFGLTVRVGGALRELLVHARRRTGRTTQSILHDALVQYLALLDRERGQR
jgi:hypothetical protein